MAVFGIAGVSTLQLNGIGRSIAKSQTHVESNANKPGIENPSGINCTRSGSLMPAVYCSTLLSLPIELHIQIAEILLRSDIRHVSSMSRTCRRLYNAAARVLYRSFFVYRLPDQCNFSEILPRCVLPEPISPMACGFVNELVISYSTFILQCASDRYNSVWARIVNCGNLRRVHLLESSALDGFHVEQFLAKKNASRTWRLLQRCFISNPFINVTELRVCSQILCRRGIPCQILPYLPSLHTLDTALCDVPMLGLKSRYTGYDDHTVLYEDISALALYCPGLEVLKLPVWEPAFGHSDVRTALSKFVNLRQLWFQKQLRLGVRKQYPIRDYIGFRLQLQQKVGVEVIDLETMTFLSSSALAYLDYSQAEMMLDYIWTRLSSNAMVQFFMKIEEYPAETPVSIFHRYSFPDNDRFQMPKRVNLRLVGNTPLFSRLPHFITSVTFAIEPQTTLLHWLPMLHKHVSSPTLRAMSLEVHHATFKEFPLYVKPPEDIGFKKKLFQFCWWRRPIAGPPGLECIHYHHNWSYFGDYQGHWSHDENLETEPRSTVFSSCMWYQWPTDSGELDIMEKYGMEMDTGMQFEKHLIALADSAAYVAFHLDVQISNYRRS